MKLSDIKSVIQDNLDAGISTEIKSSPGRGKSELIEQIIADNSARDGFEWGLATCFLATMNPSDMMGYMVPTQMSDGSLASVFTTPSWMLTPATPEHPKGRHLHSFKRGIVFLDEYGQGDADTKKVAAQLLLKGEVGPHRIPPGWGVVAASNGKGDRSGVTKDFDFVINRRMEVTVTDDIDSWLDWAARNHVSAITSAFAKIHPNIVFSDGVPEKQGPWTTPRTLVMADKLLQIKAARNNGRMPDDPATNEAIHGILGAGAAAYFSFLKLQLETPAYADIVANPMTTKVPTKPDVQMLICYDLAHRVTDKDCTSVLAYIGRMTKEFAVTFATTACRRKPMLVGVPAFQKWASDNSAIMAAISMPVK